MAGTRHGWCAFYTNSDYTSKSALLAEMTFVHAVEMKLFILVPVILHCASLGNLIHDNSWWGCQHLFCYFSFLPEGIL